jgi:hypothetical protein
MKDKLTIISDDLNHDIITELEARKQLLILLGVSTCTDLKHKTKMDIEQKVKTKLLIRGFSNENLLNNRGLIGATTDETILEVVKNLGIANVSNRQE